MEGLNADEQAQFKEMEKQESSDQAALKIEKETAPEPVEQPEAPKEPEKTVPLNALQEERERRKTAEEKARQSELNQVRLDERLKAINERLQPPQAPKELPDPETNALENLKGLNEEMKELRKFKESQANQTRNQQIAQQIISQASQKEAEFAKDNPDYNEAGSFLMKSRFDELVALGQDPFTANNTVFQEKLHLAAQALQMGKNPAEVAYSLAKSRGYAKQTQAAPPSNDADKLAKIAEGQRANTSLGSLPSTPAKPTLSGKDLLAMDEDEFGKFLEGLPEKKRAQFLGA